MNDYCFALESYPKCSYEQLRDFLVLPSKRQLQYITSSVDKDHVLRETFAKIQTLQRKNVVLLADEEIKMKMFRCLANVLLNGLHNREKAAKKCSASPDLSKEGPDGRLVAAVW